MKNKAVVRAGLFIFGVAVGVLLGSFNFEDWKTYAVVNGQKIKGADVLPRIEQDLNSLEKSKYELKKNATKEIIHQRLHVNQPPPDYQSREVSKTELENYLKTFHFKADRLSKKDLVNVINNIKLQDALANQKKVSDEALGNAKIEWNLKPPAFLKYSGGTGLFESRGDGEKIIEIANFHCPFCANAEKQLAQYAQAHKFKLYFRFLVNGPETSMLFKTAEGAFCANDQKKFWEYHDLVFQKPPLDDAALLKIAQALNLDVSAFTDCLKTGKHKKDLQKESADVEASGISVAPTFVVNGYMSPSLGGQEGMP